MHQHIVAYTLIDVSDTSALQQQNYNTLLQTIALRANPISYTYSMMGYQPMEDYEFGPLINITVGIKITANTGNKAPN